MDGGFLAAPLKRDSIIVQAAQEICRLIDTTGLRAGEALPPETKLSEMLAISRNSVREAMRMLHGLGVVEKSSGRGAIVTASSTAGFGAVNEAAVKEAAPLAHEVRAMIMQRCAGLAAKRLTEADLKQMHRELDALTAAAGQGDRAEAKRAHDAFYGLILGGARNPLLVAIFHQAHSARLTAISAPADKTFISQRHLEQHAAVLHALTQRDPDAASRAVRRHFLTLRPMVAVAAGRPI
jgi:DNA-binding FadR family transcriptional regulator